MDFKANTFDSGSNNHEIPVSPFPSIDEPAHVGLGPSSEPIRSDSRLQIWKCRKCEQRRQWGFGPCPLSAQDSPLLNCKACEKRTRHEYDGWVTSRNYSEIDFGGEL